MVTHSFRLLFIFFFFVFFCIPQLDLWGSPLLVRFWCMWLFFFTPTIEVVIFHLHEWCMLDVFLFPSSTCLRHERQESVRWNACMHRPDLRLYSHLKEFWGNGVGTHVNSKGKIPSTRKLLPRGGWNPWCCIKQDSEPNTLPRSCSTANYQPYINNLQSSHHRKNFSSKRFLLPF